MARITPRTAPFIAALLLTAAGGLVGCDTKKADQAASAPAQAQAAALPQPQADCSFSPVLDASGSDDGKLSLKNVHTAGQPASAVSALLVSGKEAAASGRQHDAEIAFLGACRSAEGMKEPNPLLVADAMYQLARHYGSAAQLGGGGKRGELLDRAAHLYAASLQTYTARYGDKHEKTRFAQEGLATVMAAGGGTTHVAAAAPAKPAAVAPTPPPKVQARAEPAPAAPAQGQVAVEPQPTPEPPQSAAEPKVVRAPSTPAEPKIATAPAPAAEARIATAPAPAAEPKPAAAPKAAAEARTAAASRQTSEPSPATAATTAPARAPEPQVATAPRSTAQPKAAPAPRSEPEPSAASARQRAPETSVAAAPPLPAPARSRVIESKPPAAAPTQQARTSRPSFDCSKARSASERLICENDDLARQDRELARLHARAKSASPDPREFQRRSDEAWSRREAECSDADCVRRWYGERRAQLERQQPTEAQQEAGTVRLRPQRARPVDEPVVVQTVPQRDEPPAQASGNPTGLQE